MVAAKLGDIWVMGDKVIQEVGQLVALAQRHVAADQVLVHDPQVEVIAEGMNVHQVPHFVALFSEEHGELRQVDEEKGPNQSALPLPGHTGASHWCYS